MTTVNEITPARLRELAASREGHGKVLSLYVNLDPTAFATRPARATEINSVLDEAERAVRDDERLTHDERVGLRSDLVLAREALTRNLDFDGARGLALFSGSGLFEMLRLPRPVPHHVAIGDAPHVEPLTRLGTGGLWWIALVDRRRARLLAGTPDGLVELWRVDDEIHGQHDQGGWSQARYQRSVDKEADDHLRGVGDELARRLRTVKIDGLLLGGSHETLAHFEALLHNDVARCVKGHFEADVWNSTADDVLAAARPVLEDLRRGADAELLERLAAGLGKDGRATAGLEATLAAVHERRVETLLVDEGLAAAGVRCPQCGWLGITAGAACPADGSATEPEPNVVETAIQATLLQDAQVRTLRRERPDDPEPLAQHEGIAAITRF